ncbi:hypothetical protein [Extibacter muris]|uniref:Uncharacterized protein n=1 Tax=Extibacter muris TaxID=1796622 RepID=A0A4R4FE63_9FIRM|nr:hypothetical protein [Extibacter muris]MCU0078783.1 hypothetical protein [Extibacter muris]TDA21825.1 hypothetical protein E1963_08655 [Extibacter muris]
MRPGTATITQIPKPVECSPIAALIPRAKESVPESLVCGRGAAISDSAAKLGGRGLVEASVASEQMPSGSPPAAHFT